MSEHIKLDGHCLCGAIRFEAYSASSEVGACHCGMCQRWVAGPLLTVAVDSGAVKIDGDEHLGVYGSSEWGERQFCKRCGTALFWRTRDGANFYVSAGALSDKSHLHLGHELFIDQKPGYYAFANDTHKVTGEEFLAMFAGPTTETR